MYYIFALFAGFSLIIFSYFYILFMYPVCDPEPGCEIDWFNNKSPLVLSPTKSSLLYPNYGKRTLEFRKGETIEFACPGNNNNINIINYPKTIKAKCISRTKFQISGKQYFWADIVCRYSPTSTIRRTNSQCAVNSKLVEIGFDLENGRFISTITICFNALSRIPLYSRYDITASIQSKIVTYSPPTFFEDRDLYNFQDRVDTYYKKNKQRITVNNLLGLPSSSLIYIRDNDFFLSRGHLAAKSDFFYSFQQIATFRFINVAPQWQSFNGGNWNEAEKSTRNYADTRKANLNIWTGTYGIATLPHEATKQPIELYLYVNEQTKALPVPAIFWKIVYNPTNKGCVVLIGLNNPFEENIKKYRICTDISNRLGWLRWEKTNKTMGYSYACACPDFKKRVAYAPSLNVLGILN